MNPMPAPQLRRMRVLIVTTLLYGLFGLAMVVWTFWRPLPDYKTLQDWTIGLRMLWIFASTLLTSQLVTLPDPDSLSTRGKLKRYLLPWGLIQLALLICCLAAFSLVSPATAIGQQEQQVILLRIDACFPPALAVGFVPEIARHLSRIQRMPRM